MEVRIGHLEGIKHKLNSLSMYSLSEFKTEPRLFKTTLPSEAIANFATKLGECRINNHDHFVSQTTSLFRGYSRDKDIDLIDKNKLIATLFVLDHPFSEPKPRVHQEIKYRSKQVIKMLLGLNEEYVSGKKFSEHIQPIYLVLRALKERRSSWLAHIFQDLDPNQSKIIFNKTEEIKAKLINSINQPKEKAAIRELFESSLNFKRAVEMPAEETQIEEPLKTLKQKRGLDYTPKHYLHDKVIATDNTDELTENDDERRTIMKKIFEVSDLKLSNSGIISIDEKGLEKLMATFQDTTIFPKGDYFQKNISNLTSVLGKRNYKTIALASLVTSLSENKQTGKWIFRDIKGRDYGRIKLLNVFENTVAEIFTERSTQELVVGLNESIKNRSTDFGPLNEKIALILYKHNFPNDEIIPSRLFHFVNSPGISDMIFSLRKLFFLKTIKSKISFIPEAIQNQEFYLRTSGEIWDTTHRNQEDYIEMATHDHLDPLLFADYPAKRILQHLSLFSLEKYLKDRKGRFDRARYLIPHKKEEITMFNPLTEDDIIVTDEGISIPIQLRHKRDVLSVYFKNVELGNIPIVVEN